MRQRIAVILFITTICANSRSDHELCHYIRASRRRRGVGLASTLFLLSGAIHLAGISLALLYTVAFAFGFSERLVINSVNRVTTGSNANTKQD